MTATSKVKNSNKIRRQARVKAKIKGSASRPRLAVFRSLQHIYAQLIDDQSGKTLAAASDKELTGQKAIKPVDRAFKVGELLAAKASKAGISQAVFYRAGYQYHGRVKALAEGARKGGLLF